MVAPASTYTLGDVVTYVQRQFGDEDNVQITAVDITRWVNQAQISINSKDPMVQGKGVVTTTGAETSFTLPADLMQLDMVTYDSVRLQPIDPGGGLDQAALTGTGGSSPIYFYTWANAIYLVPAPDAAGHSLNIYYTARPTMVVSTADLLGVPDRYFEEVCSFVMAKAYELDQDWQAQTAVKQAYDQGMQEKMQSNKNVIGSNLVIRDAETEYDEFYYGGY